MKLQELELYQLNRAELPFPDLSALKKTPQAQWLKTANFYFPLTDLLVSLTLLGQSGLQTTRGFTYIPLTDIILGPRPQGDY